MQTDRQEGERGREGEAPSIDEVATEGVPEGEEVFLQADHSLSHSTSQSRPTSVSCRWCAVYRECRLFLPSTGYNDSSGCPFLNTRR